MNKTEHVTNKDQDPARIPNKLIGEKSPYLLQHAYNPVDWYPWGEEAFAKAKAEDKPIFLSIGYSTCHWCHVMAHESFEDKEVSELLNKYFVSIKVDKEERPDIDSIYMSACMKITGSGGWPLTIMMFPDQKPFFAGTYFPKRSRYNMPGLMDLLKAVHDKWENDRDSLIRSSETLTNAIKEEYAQDYSEKVNPKDLLRDAAQTLILHGDKEFGGFGHAPKFPAPHNLMYLLRVAHFEKNQKALELVEKTLTSMYQGGIFDHIGYGFSRYSTDNKWLVPHFEKMLYDNGLLIIAYLECYQLTHKKQYKEIAEMTMEYVLRELTAPEGGFYCAQDADSEGVEGKYYVFTPDEIIEVLGREDGEYFNKYYGITEGGNFEGQSIPNRLHIDFQTFNDKEESLEPGRISTLRKKVYDYRLNRTKLHKDDKILTSWNGIMIAAFAKAYMILREEKYLNAAREAEQFIQDRLSKDGRLYVHYRDGMSTGIGHIDDYAFYIWALLSLYEATLDANYLEKAIEYTRIMVKQFFGLEKGGFYLYSVEGEQLIHRPKEVYDGAIPSGNSVAAYVLSKLASFTGDLFISETAEKQMEFIIKQAADYPSSHTFSLMAVMLQHYQTKELICVVQNDSQLKELHELTAKNFLPNVTIVGKTMDNEEQLKAIAEYTADYSMKEDKATYYLCENHACMAPKTDIHNLEELLIKNGARH